MKKVITKSKFQALLQCPKRMNLVLDHRELASPVDEAAEYRFEFGRKVEAKAQEMFADGVMIEATADLKSDAEKTKASLKNNNLIFEAAFYGESTFSNYDAFIRVDVLEVLDGNKVKIFEIKSSTKRKPEYITDVWFQKWLIENITEFEVVEANVIYVDPSFIIEEGFEPKDMFIIEDLTSIIEDEIDETPADIVNSLSEEDFNISVGPYCKSPYPCEFSDYCFSQSEIGSVLNLRRGGRKIWDLFEQGINEIKDIPTDYKLTSFQEIQKQTEISGEQLIDKQGIKIFLQSVTYPAFFLDFESCNPPAFGEVIWPGYSLYGQAVFQLSLHVLESPEAEPKHYEYLHCDTSEPSESVAKFLVEHIGEVGSVIAYHKSFEGSRLIEIAEKQKDFASALLSMKDRLLDLEDVFTAPYIYDSQQKGSTSIKKTLGVVCPEFEKAYEELDLVNNGQLATMKYLEMISPATEKSTKEMIEAALLKYCFTDTLALIKIFRRLIDISK